MSETGRSRTCGADGCDRAGMAFRTVVLRDYRLSLVPVEATYDLCLLHSQWFENEGYVVQWAPSRQP